MKTKPTRRVPVFSGASLAVAHCLAAVTLTLWNGATVRASDQTGNYDWSPVRIGAGGWVDGFVTHPQDPSVRYVRTDVGNAYRWDPALQEWMPMLVRHETGTARGFSLADSPEPSQLAAGVLSIAIDPSNKNVVYVATRQNTLAGQIVEIKNRTQIFKSTDGGRNLVRVGNLGLDGNPNDSSDSYFRRWGERLKVDPLNGSVLYYGHYESGVWRSADGGQTWANILPGRNSINVIFDTARGTVQAAGGSVCRRIYVVSRSTAQSVCMSDDGGTTWTNITPPGLLNYTELKDGNVVWVNRTGQGILGPDGDLWIVCKVQEGNEWKLYRYRASLQPAEWTTRKAPSNLINIAFSPAHPGRIFGLEDQLHLFRSTDDGQNWTRLTLRNEKRSYANTFAWMPDPGTEGHSCSRMEFDTNGVGWIPNGNYGVLRFSPSANNTENEANPMQLTIDARGIEELVGSDIAIPPAGNGSAFIAAMDEGGFHIQNPDQFTAIRQLLSAPTKNLTCGLGVSYAPDRPNKMILGSSDYFLSRANFSGFSSDYGKSWSLFEAVAKRTWPTFLTTNGAVQAVQTGEVAISGGSYGTRWTGTENIVYQPVDGFVPLYSTDGGRTFQWASVPGAVNNKWPDARTPGTIPWQSTWSLQADPHVPGKFYIAGKGRLFVSTDGGAVWAEQPGVTLAAQQNLVVNRAIPNQLWSAGAAWDAKEPLRRLDWNPSTNAWVVTTLTTFKRTHKLAIGAGRGLQNDAPYTLYVYGVLSSDTTNRWGIFRSMDGGESWERISYFPNGMVEDLRRMAASWDEFGLVYFTTSGNSAGFGRLMTPPAGTIPRPPAVLSAFAANGRVMLEWTPTPGATSYNVKRSTISGSGYTTIAAGLPVPRLLDTGVLNDQTYYYIVEAVGAGGTSSPSHQTGCRPTAAGVAPAGMTLQNIGTVGGLVVSRNDAVVLVGGGTDIAGNSDQFTFLSKSLESDGEVNAKVTHIDATHPDAKAGLMIRQDTGAGSRNVLLAVTSSNQIVMQARSSTSGATTNVTAPVSVAGLPVQLRLVRTGNTFTGFYKPSVSQPWVRLGETMISMPVAVTAGLAHVSRQPDRFGAAAFEELNRSFNTSSILVEERDFASVTPRAPFTAGASARDTWIGGQSRETEGNPGGYLQNNPWQSAAFFAREWRGLSGQKNWTFSFDLKVAARTNNGHPIGAAVFGMVPGAALTANQVQIFLNTGALPRGVTALTSRNLVTRLTQTSGWLRLQETFSADLSVYSDVVIALFSNADGDATTIRGFDNVLLYNSEGPPPGAIIVVTDGSFSAPLPPADYTAGNSVRKRWIGGGTMLSGGDPDNWLQNGPWNYASWYGVRGADYPGLKSYTFSSSLRVQCGTNYNQPVGIAVFGLGNGTTITRDQLRNFLANGVVPAGVVPLSSRSMRTSSINTQGWIYFQETIQADLSAFSDVVIGFYSNTDNPAGAIRGIDNVIMSSP